MSACREPRQGSGDGSVKVGEDFDGPARSQRQKAVM